MTLRLFVDSPQAGQRLETGLLALPPSASRHVQVRRMQPGDALVVFDGSGGEWRAEIVDIGRRDVSVRLVERDDGADAREMRIAVTLAVGMPANERMDALVEKAVELGAAALQPLRTRRSVLRLADDRAARRRAHWQSVAAAAAEQCGRTRVPTIAPVADFDRWLGTTADGGTAERWLLAPGAAPPRAEALDGVSRLLLLSGPEGGLGDEERAAAQAAGFAAVGLGPRVLRADTAPLAALAWIALITAVA